MSAQLLDLGDELRPALDPTRDDDLLLLAGSPAVGRARLSGGGGGALGQVLWVMPRTCGHLGRIGTATPSRVDAGSRILVATPSCGGLAAVVPVLDGNRA